MKRIRICFIIEIVAFIAQINLVSGFISTKLSSGHTLAIDVQSRVSDRKLEAGTLLHMSDNEDDSYEKIELKVPPSNSGLVAQMKIKKLLSTNSEIVEVRYRLPFGLDVEPKQGKIVCTKDGKGGEKVGDILRYTSAWSMGLPRGDGLVTTAASFAGGLSWQCNMFNVMEAETWQEVIEALTSNVESRTDEVVLLFEREV